MNNKDYFWAVVVFVLIVMTIGFLITVKPEPVKYMSAQEKRQLEADLINRYGSLDNAEAAYKSANDPGNGVGHPLWNN